MRAERPRSARRALDFTAGMVVGVAVVELVRRRSIVAAALRAVAAPPAPQARVAPAPAPEPAAAAPPAPEAERPRRRAHGRTLVTSVALVAALAAAGYFVQRQRSETVATQRPVLVPATAPTTTAARTPPTTAPAKTTAAPAKTTAAPAKTTAAPAKTTAAAKRPPATTARPAAAPPRPKHATGATTTRSTTTARTSTVHPAVAGFVPARTFLWAPRTGATGYLVTFFRDGRPVLRTTTRTARLQLPRTFVFHAGRYRWTVRALPARPGEPPRADSAFVLTAAAAAAANSR